MMTKKRYIALKLVEAGEIIHSPSLKIFQERREDHELAQRTYRWLMRKGYIRLESFGRVVMTHRGRDYFIGQYFV